MARTFLFTVDTEWAHPEILQDLLSLFENSGVAVTLFCTEGQRVQADPRHEIALHPNVERLEEAEAAMQRLHAMYPEAKGIRSHALVSSSRFYPLYRTLGLTYHSNHYTGEPFSRIVRWQGVAGLPIFYMDHIHVSDPAWNPDFRLDAMDLLQDGTYVFDFHPVLTFINCSSEEQYLRAKECYSDPASLRKMSSRTRGVKSLLQDLLVFTCSQGITTRTCSEFLSSHDSSTDKALHRR